MKQFGDLELTDAQAAALMAWLDERVADAERRAAQERERERTRAWDERCDARLEHLARLTAQMHGRLPGLPVDEAAASTWRAFVASEGFFSRSDVHEHFDPSDWGDAWTATYSASVRLVESGELPKITVDEAAQLVGPALE